MGVCGLGRASRFARGWFAGQRWDAQTCSGCCTKPYSNAGQFHLPTQSVTCLSNSAHAFLESIIEPTLTCVLPDQYYRFLVILLQLPNLEVPKKLTVVG